MVTKRQLGIAVVAAAALLILGLVAADVVGAGRWGGFGPLQRIGLAFGGGLIVVGLLLMRLGNRPA
ncbi:MAG: hypothetical protein ONB14_12285 [candidate division KSB1 bacterium]|nr:hypothetical protein [candidate division KSB1 bacterium]